MAGGIARSEKNTNITLREASSVEYRQPITVSLVKAAFGYDVFDLLFRVHLTGRTDGNDAGAIR